MLYKIDNFLKNIYRFSGYIAALFLILVATFILIGIASRIFGFYIRGLAEYSGYCMAASSFFALAYTFVEGGHIRITLFLEKFSGFKKNVSEYIDGVIDSDPNKHGLYIPNTSIKVFSILQSLKQKPDVIIILALSYIDEIKKIVRKNHPKVTILSLDKDNNIIKL